MSDKDRLFDTLYRYNVLYRCNLKGDIRSKIRQEFEGLSDSQYKYFFDEFHISDRFNPPEKIAEIHDVAKGRYRKYIISLLADKEFLKQIHFEDFINLAETEKFPIAFNVAKKEVRTVLDSMEFRQDPSSQQWYRKGALTKCSLEASRSIISSGEKVELKWITKNATAFSVIGIGELNPIEIGSIIVSPELTTTYTGIATGAEGNVTCSVTIIVKAETIVSPISLQCSLKSSKLEIEEGEDVELSWGTQNSETLSINNVNEYQVLKGSKKIRPTSTTTYTAIAKNGNQEVSKSITIKVNALNVNLKEQVFNFLQSSLEIEGGQKVDKNDIAELIAMFKNDNSPAGLLKQEQISIFIKEFIDINGLVSVGRPRGNSLGEELTSSDWVNQKTIKKPPADKISEVEKKDVEQILPVPSPPVKCSFWTSTAEIKKGEKAILNWKVENAVSFSINGKNITPIDKGQLVVSPTETTTYYAKAVGKSGEVSRSVIVTVIADLVSGPNIPEPKNPSLIPKYLKWLGIIGVLIFSIYFISSNFLLGSGDPYYIYADSANLRTDEGASDNESWLASFPYGTLVKSYSNSEYEPNQFWHKVKVDGKKGFMSGDLILPETDFKILENVFGNAKAKELVVYTIYRKAIVDYYKEKGFSTDEWKLYANIYTGTVNTIYYSRIVDRYNTQNDFAFILTNTSYDRRFVLLTFDKNNKMSIVCEQDAPKTGEIKSVEYNSTSKCIVNYTGKSTSKSKKNTPIKVEAQVPIEKEVEKTELPKIIDIPVPNVVSIPTKIKVTADVPAPPVESQENINSTVKGTKVNYDGSIGKSSISMSLEYTGRNTNCNKDGQNIIGTYYYLSQGSIKKKNVSGSTCGNSFSLREVNGYGDIVGTFTGEINRNGKIKGKVLNGKKESSFTLN
jgi:hypothetical protein